MLSDPTISARPSVEEVCAWLTGHLSDEALDDYVAALRSDPNWIVLQLSGTDSRTLTLYYGPLGDHLTAYLVRKGADWHASVIPPETALTTAGGGRG